MTTQKDAGNAAGHAPDEDEVWLVYDGLCPVCSFYCRYVRIRQAVGTLHLVDAREPGPLMDEINAAGLDIDQGMVLKFRDAIYYGSDAVHMLALLGSPSSLFNTINFHVFRTRLGARIIYPLGKAFRNAVLKLLGITYIDNLKQGATQ